VSDAKQPLTPLKLALLRGVPLRLLSCLRRSTQPAVYTSASTRLPFSSIHTRRLSRVVLPPVGTADATFTMLMGKGEAASRRAWMEEKGNLVEADV
jgi:hypothetical protein